MAANTCGVCGRDIALMSASGRSNHETRCLVVLHGALGSSSSSSSSDADDQDGEQQQDGEHVAALEMMEEDDHAPVARQDDGFDEEPSRGGRRATIHAPFPKSGDYKLAKVCVVTVIVLCV